jgi:hypothetical protein
LFSVAFLLRSGDEALANILGNNREDILRHFFFLPADVVGSIFEVLSGALLFDWGISDGFGIGVGRAAAFHSATSADTMPEEVHKS